MNEIPRCQVVPQAGNEVSFRIDGREILRWHAGLDYPRPFFFPVIGPSGTSVTRMGHPGAPDHDHHQSMWFAHHKVLGISFWSNASEARIQQSQWFAYEDGPDECRFAVNLQWLDGHDPRPLMNQQLICCIRPESREGEFLMEIQSRFLPTSNELEFQQSNFGCFAVRVAAQISGHFGGGQLTNSSGGKGESEIFEKPAQWVDYSGVNGTRKVNMTEGISYFDHPSNPGQPTGWHVREDGWMCASPTMHRSLMTSMENPLQLRYLLLVHQGAVDVDRNRRLHQDFATSPALMLSRSTAPHQRWRISRDA